jgi:hypothetical protein
MLYRRALRTMNMVHGLCCCDVGKETMTQQIQQTRHIVHAAGSEAAGTWLSPPCNQL